MLSKRYESIEVDRRLGYMCPRGLAGPKTKHVRAIGLCFDTNNMQHIIYKQ